MRKHFKHHHQRSDQNTGAHCSAGELPHGCRAMVCGLNGDSAQRSRLCAMGITPGTEVEACRGFPGRCRLRVRGGSFALDKELAEQILCEICQTQPAEPGEEEVQGTL